MRIDYERKVDFDDVLIRPKRSEAPSRSAIELKREYRFLHSRQTWRGIPIIASNMDTIGTMDMARALAPDMMTCLHKHYSIQELAEFLAQEQDRCNVYMTVGIRDEDWQKLQHVCRQIDLKWICVDAANGYTRFFVDQVKRIRDALPSTTLMAGNVATPDMVQELLISGAADIIKVGIGSGSACTTRQTTAVGYPQLSAIIECADAAHGLRGHVCADGGCRTPGDVVKAFAAGADFVMLGGMLAGHDECDAKWTENSDGRHMKFYGMASRTAMDKYAGGAREYRACEGAEMEISYRGSVQNTLQEITGGIRSACAYVGAARLKDLSKCATFVICRA